MTEEWVSPDTPGSSPAPAQIPTAVDDASQLDEIAGFGALRHDEEADLGGLLGSLQRRQFLLFKPGEPAQVVSSLHQKGGVAIYLSRDELVFHNGMRTFRCRVGEPADPGLAKLPLVAKLVAVFIHHPPAGPGPARYVYALDAARGVIAKVDDTGTWEFRSDLLDQACELIGLLFERESFERVEDLLSTHPNLAEPKLEFEAHHPAEEAVRELSIGVFYGGLLAAGLLSSGGMALAFVNPVGNFYKGLIALGCVVMCVLSWWSLSKRRMRRSMRGPPRCPSALVAVRHLSGAAVSNSPRLVLICGLPGAGKTTLARRREAEIPGTRLSPDEWMVALGVGLWDDEFRGRLETQLWSLAQELLAKGQSVVLDYGYWTRAERDEKRLLARSLGVKVELHYLKASIEELEQRLEKRNLSVEWRDFPITREHLETWSLTFEPPGPEELLLFDQ